jgi:peptide/nickel transport system permease protein
MRFMARRLAFYLAAGWVAVTLNFLIPRLMPGNPVEILISRFPGQLSGSATRALTAAFGLASRQNLVQQYLTYVGNLAHGNLGLSITYYPSTVASVVRESLPWTLVLVGLSTVASFTLGTLIGILVAWRRSRWMDGLLPLTTFLAAVPYFFLALVAITVFAVTLHWLPASGGYDLGQQVSFSASFILSAGQHAILPAVTIVASSIAGWMLGMRNVMITTMSADYVLTAQAKGLSGRRVMFAYAARNAILPNVSGFALALGFVVGGAFLTEYVFSYPGIGYVLLQAVSNDDYPLMQGIFLIISLSVLAANLLADACYVLLDPRIRRQG